MFPLVHCFVNHKIYRETPLDPLLILGALWPDLARGANCSRNAAHRMGDDFYRWCREQAPAALPLARGIISHGIRPCCVDFYADEYWPGYVKGWCFGVGAAYIPRVEKAMDIPHRFAWWKSHNFVEMSYELMIAEDAPQIAKMILEASRNEEAKTRTASYLAAWYDCDQLPIYQILGRVPEIFAIETITPTTLIERQKEGLKFKPGCEQARPDADAAAQLLTDMYTDLRPGWPPFRDRLVQLTGNVLRLYS